MIKFVENTTAIYLDMAPWLLIGFVVAGLIKAWVSEDWMVGWLGGKGFLPILKAALVGAPLPLCSCSVLPAVLSLHRAGASKEASVSFLVATPETGADSVAISYVLLGPFLAVVRPVAAILSACFAGVLTMFVTSRWPQPESAKPATLGILATPSTSSCCCSCQSEPQRQLTRPNVFQRTAAGLKYALTEIVDDLAMWLGIGILLASLMLTLVPAQALSQWGSGVGAMLLLIIISIPMYICATASTPIGAAMIAAGISPGTVLVFLMAGPATNIATLAIVKKEFGVAVLAAYLTGVVVSSIVAGLSVDFLIELWQIDNHVQLSQVTEIFPLWLSVVAGAVCLVLAIPPLRNLVLPKTTQLTALNT